MAFCLLTGRIIHCLLLSKILPHLLAGKSFLDAFMLIRSCFPPLLQAVDGILLLVGPAQC